MLRIAFVCLLVVSSSTYAADEPSRQLTSEPIVTEHDDWISRCVKPVDSNEFCEAIQVILINRDQVSGRVLETSLRRLNEKEIVMQFVLPFGVDLRPGVAFRIDENEERKAGFLTCLQQGCLVQMLVNDNLMTELKDGSQARLGFRPLGSPETVVVEISLKGFSASTKRL
jgi:invasion protein IalB